MYTFRLVNSQDKVFYSSQDSYKTREEATKRGKSIGRYTDASAVVIFDGTEGIETVQLERRAVLPTPANKETAA